MKTIEKLTLYRERLASWKQKQASKTLGSIFEKEPLPEDFKLHTPAEKLVAERVRIQILENKAQK